MAAVLVAAEAPPPYAAGRDAAAGFALIEQGLALLAAQVLGGAVDDADLAVTVEELHRVEARVRAEKLRRIAEVDARQAAAGLGARTTTELLAGRLGLSPREARAQTQTAQALAELPETAEGLRDGRIGVDQAQAVVRVYHAMDTGGDDDVRRAFDRRAATQARTRTAAQLKDSLEAFAHQQGSDHLADRDRRAFRQRAVRRWVDTERGLWRADIALPVDMGAVVDTAIDAVVRRDQRDHRDHASADAGDGCGDPGCAQDTGGDGRSWPQRSADALVAMAQQTLADPGLPTMGGAQPHVIVTVTDDGAPAQLDGVGAIADATAEQIRCDAETTVVVRARNGQVLDAGRSRRTPTPRQRAAVIARDRRCVGCGAPASRCQVHHVRWWDRDGGRTDEPNLVLVCWSCHHHVHHHGWTITGDHLRGFRIDRTPTGARLPVGAGRRRTP